MKERAQADYHLHCRIPNLPGSNLRLDYEIIKANDLKAIIFYGNPSCSESGG